VEGARIAEVHNRAPEHHSTRKRFVETSDFVKMPGRVVKMAGRVRDSK
jgi:hypothetical protein